MNTLETITEMRQNQSLAKTVCCFGLVKRPLELGAKVVHTDKSLERLTELSKRYESHLDRIENLAERHEKSLAKLPEISKHCKRQFVYVKNDTAQAKGRFFEDKWSKNAISYLGCKEPGSARFIDKEALADLLDKTEVEDGILLVDVVHSPIPILHHAELLEPVAKRETISCAPGVTIDTSAQRPVDQQWGGRSSTERSNSL